MPVGPTCRPPFVRDTLESVRHYTTPSRAIIIIDDSQAGIGRSVASDFDDCVVLENVDNHGTYAGLYRSLSKGMSYAVERYELDILLRLDTDALVVGERPEDAALEIVRADPRVAILGSHLVDCAGRPRDPSPGARRLTHAASLSRLPLHPHRLRHVLWIRETIRRALSEGYFLGENCLGGAVFMSGAAVRRLHEADLLGRRDFDGFKLHEDVIFALLVRSVGMELADLGTGDLPMGIAWAGLPLAPEELVRRNKKVIHSVRYHEDLREEEIRAFFRERRRAGAELDSPGARRTHEDG